MIDDDDDTNLEVGPLDRLAAPDTEEAVVRRLIILEGAVDGTADVTIGVDRFVREEPREPRYFLPSG